MRGYGHIGVATSACVRFVRNSEMDGSEREEFAEARARGIRVAYVDATAISSPTDLTNLLANALQLENAPYDFNQWVCLLDDLVGLSHHAPGLIIVVDGAWTLTEKLSEDMFDLIEAFLIQFDSWSKQRKPCYLCFQMERNKSLTEFFNNGGQA